MRLRVHRPGPARPARGHQPRAELLLVPSRPGRLNVPSARRLRGIDVLIFAAPLRAPELRHEIPAGIGDPFLYAEHDGRTFVLISTLDADNVRAARPDAELLAPEAFGIDDLLAAGAHRDDAERELVLRACRELGVRSAAVPPSFPVALADHLRAGGVELVPDRELFDGRRRAKTERELAGIRRAQRAAEAGMRVAAQMLAAAEPGAQGVLRLDGEPLTSERIRAAVEAAFAAHDAVSDGFIVAHGAQGAVGHDLGSGPIAAGEPVIVDLWPADRATSCFADMTRTFVVGEPGAQLAAWHGLCRDALARCVEAVRPGLRGRAVWEVACDVFEAAGEPTQRTKQPGEVLREGFFHGLGHGVGLEVHEAPGLGRGPDVLQAGDVVAIEPGTYRRDRGGVRLEDLVLVTEDGAEVLTDFPYGLEPSAG
ncbi:MAG TPA: Xaa-Pro peptidase family protein [Solirubrobacteraceae bacterium]